MPSADRYAFGGFVLDRLQERVLRSDGTPVNLTPRLFSALTIFIERAGELLDKESLMTALWPGLVVEENNLNQVVHGLRRALGDDGSRYIQTVPRRGFRFVAPVARLPASAAPQSASASAPLAVSAAQHEPESAGPFMSAAHDGASAVQRRRVYVAAAAALGATGVGWWALRWRQGSSVPRPATTLAVLPFQFLNAPADGGLLGVGMADSLVARLSVVPGLVVRSISSVLRYKPGQHDPLGAARELEVAWIVDGSLQREGDRLRVTARLLRASDGTSAWSGSFDEQVVDLFDVQDHIATRLAQALRPALQMEAAMPAGHLLEPGGTRSIEAYQLYLTASFRQQDGRPESIAKAIALLHQAIGIDPGFALAWALLAWSHRRRLWSTDTEPAEVFREANAALDRALALAPKLAQAHAGLGFSRHWFDLDWDAGEREFRAALASNPNEVSAHQGLGILLATQDRVDEGLSHVRIARELDPMSATLNTLEASYLLESGRIAEARLRLDRALDIVPQYWLGHVVRALLHFAAQEDDAGLAVLRKAVELGKGTTRPRAVLGFHLARTGRHAEARAILDALQALSRERHVPPVSLAVVQAGLGETASALTSLEQAFATRDTRIIYMKDDPHWRSLRQEPRFQALLRQLGLDRYRRGLSPV